MITTDDPREVRHAEDWIAHDPGQHPAPQDLLGSPLSFVAWLRRNPQRRFWRPADPMHCPLATFMREESAKSWVSVCHALVTWEKPADWLPLSQGGKFQMTLPRWGRRFVCLWDAWCLLRSAALCSAWGACPSAREAHIIAWLCTASPWRLWRRLRHGEEAIP